MLSLAFCWGNNWQGQQQLTSACPAKCYQTDLTCPREERQPAKGSGGAETTPLNHRLSCPHLPVEKEFAAPQRATTVFDIPGVSYTRNKCVKVLIA